ncbi:MAG: hypothetical protein WC342_07690 [Methanoregula sp.]|jgi:hypothetical protein
MAEPDQQHNTPHENTLNANPGNAGREKLPGQQKSNPVLVVVCCIIIVAGLAIIFIAPRFGFVPGTCIEDTMPMTFENLVTPSYGQSLLYEFGEPEPAAPPQLPPMADYPMQKNTIDALMARAHVNGSEESIIGRYELPDARIILVKTGENITEILEENNSVQTYTRDIRMVGNRNYTMQHNPYQKADPDNSSNNSYGFWPMIAKPTGAQFYNYTMATSDTLRRFDLILPGTANTTVPVYIINKTRSDSYLDPNNTEEFSITTTGIFYVIYGEGVEHFSYDSTITPAAGWTVCSKQIGVTMNGPTAELRHTVKLARSSERVLVGYIGVTGPYIQVSEGNMGSSMSQWISRDGTGCSC